MEQITSFLNWVINDWGPEGHLALVLLGLWLLSRPYSWEKDKDD